MVIKTDKSRTTFQKKDLSKRITQKVVRDKSNMRKIILDFPRQFRTGIEAARGVNLKPGTLSRWPENIIICGMGGSASAGEILVTLRPLDVFCHKSYGLPPQTGNESLIICLSYSGNTEETISAFQEALKRKLPLITITTGGQLEKLSKKYQIPLTKIPGPKIPPRLALGEMFSALIQILVNHHILGPEICQEILKAGAFLKTEPRPLKMGGAKVKKRTNFSSPSKGFEIRGRELAKKIFQKIPFIYTPKQFREIGLIWKNSFNETAKTIAMANYFPELNHNEIVGLGEVSKKNKLSVIILRDKKDHPRILKQMRIAKDLIEEEGTKVEFIDMAGETMLERIFSSVVLGFWTAYWLAIEYKIDPTPVKAIEEFKRKLKQI